MADRYARIKTGALVDVDFHVARWEDHGEVFQVNIVDQAMFKINGRRELTRYGYGILGRYKNNNEYDSNAYGNGCLYVKEEDLVDVDQDIVDVFERLSGKPITEGVLDVPVS
jgi:hypothetical protein